MGAKTLTPAPRFPGSQAASDEDSGSSVSPRSSSASASSRVISRPCCLRQMANPQPGFDFDFHESQPQPARLDLTVPPQPSVGTRAERLAGRRGLRRPARSCPCGASRVASSRDTSPRPRCVFQITNPQPGSLRLFHDVQPKARLFSTILPPQSGVGQSPIGSRFGRLGQLAGAQQLLRHLDGDLGLAARLLPDHEAAAGVGLGVVRRAAERALALDDLAAAAGVGQRPIDGALGAHLGGDLVARDALGDELRGLLGRDHAAAHALPDLVAAAGLGLRLPRRARVRQRPLDDLAVAVRAGADRRAGGRA